MTRCCCAGRVAACNEIERVLGSALVRPPDDLIEGDRAGAAAGAGNAGLALCAAHAGAARRDPARGGRGIAGIRPRQGVAGIDATKIVMNLSERGDLTEAAANLFGHLRALDAVGARGIAVMPVPHRGLGEAINDRLRRAAMPQQ